MKTLHKVIFLTLVFLSASYNGFSQHRGRGGNHSNTTVVVKKRGHRPYRNNRVVVVRSPYRPAKVVVYHPVWRPNYGYHRRWVYFPRYNFYWDNWRQGYYYRSGVTWVYNTTPPPVVVNVNLENEKNYELKEDDDDVDDIYKTNDAHQSNYPQDGK